jgi:hypothetical protein
MEGTKDIEIDEMVTGGPASRTRASDRIRGNFRNTPTRAHVHIDLIEEVLTVIKPPHTGSKTRSEWKTMGGGLRGAKTRGICIPR